MSALERAALLFLAINTLILARVAAEESLWACAFFSVVGLSILIHYERAAPETCSDLDHTSGASPEGNDGAKGAA